MPNQYQGFTNPTIVPDQKYGWEAANQSAQGAMGGISQYLMQQQQARQGIQLEQAKTLSQYQNMIQASTGQRNPNIDAVLSQNPYGRQMVPQGANTQPQQGGQQMGMGNMQMPVSMGSPSMGGAVNFNPLGGIGGPVVTGQSQTFAPFGDMGPKTTTSMGNPQGEAQVESAKSYAGASAKAQQGAQESESRDIQQLAMVKNAIKPLVESYDQVYNSKVMGMPAAGDVYGSGLVKNADMIPQFGDLQKSIVPPETQKAAGQFLANKNELITKLQPLLSQQFGKEGSSRIMDSLIKMSQQEIGDLSTPRAQFHGQITGTLSSLYRIAKASQAYSQDLAQSGQTPDPEMAAQEIARRMSTQTLSPAEQKEMQGMIDEVVGKKELPKSADFNPLNKSSQQGQGVPKYDPKTQKLQRNTKTGEYRVVGL